MQGEKKMPAVTAIIPTYRPDARFPELIRRLRLQTVPPERILIINTEEEYFDGEKIEDWTGLSVLHIGKDQFDHGGTRDMGARMCGTPYLLFMTMDALPAGPHLIERLLAAFEDETVAASYARQLPYSRCSVPERCVRSFNYGEESRTQRLSDLDTLGVKTFLCSNVCAMYRKDVYEELGGFSHPEIFNEDMIYASAAVRAGYGIRYCADACVYHSHNYTGLRQFKRNFDLGVSQAQHPEVFSSIRSEKTGMVMVKQTVKTLLRKGRVLSLGVFFWQSACKYAGYLAGKHYRMIPRRLVPLLSSNVSYWEQNGQYRRKTKSVED